MQCTPTLWACGPLLLLWPPFTPHVRRTRKRGTARDKPPPLPLFTHEGERAPRMRAKEARARRPDHRPPPLTRERGAAQEVTRHPRLRTTGTRQAPPAPFVHARTGHANARQPPPLQLPLPFARKGGSGTETRRTGPDAGRRGTRHAHPPLPPLSRDPARKQRQRRRGGPPGLRAEAKRKRGVHARGRERARPPPSAPRPRLDARAARERGRALQVGVCPRVRAHGQRANRNAQKRSPLHDTGASEPGGRARAKRERADARKRPPPFPGSRARAKCERAAARNPLPSPAGSRAREKRERATTRKPLPLSRGFASKGETQPRGGSAPLLRVCAPGGARVGWCVTGRRANGRRAVTWWRPTLRFAHRGSTHTRAAPVRKAEEHRLSGSRMGR
ncbi:hypothetical protein EDB83DRAFT_2312462 [Lactarius deliciosus]|nr:hypothetical protein EDB83DRAFT_2312462 [Lactarius deliciosus]